MTAYKPDLRYVGGFRPQCRACANVVDRRFRRDNPDRFRRAQRKHRQNQKQKVSAIKLASGCVDCGYNEHPEALEFDHLPGMEKLFNISKNIRPWPQVLAEIAKCEVVCANCHRVRTATRGGWRNCSRNKSRPTVTCCSTMKGR